MNLFDLFAVLSINSNPFNSGISSAQSTMGKFTSKLKNGFNTIAKVGGAAFAGVSAAVIKLTKDSVSLYGEYEQLVGGVETLFGDSAEKVISDANNAFKTAGMSVNHYMETSIQAAASLINSLEGDQKRAAELMNVSIVDMADNVNKMGTSMEGVQNAYRGFSRGNFTMLDNLALGFAGTKQGMEDLLQKAEEYAAKNGEVRDFSIDSYADIVEAIHTVQVEMGISGLSAEEAAEMVKSGAMTQEEAYAEMGTTAKEAATTIQGSAGSAKAAWDNLVLSLAKPDGDITGNINIFVNSLVTMAKNVIPIANQALRGVAQFIQETVPILLEQLPTFLTDTTPALISAGMEIIQAIVTVVTENASQISDMISLIINQLITIMSENSETLIGAIMTIIQSIITSITENTEQISAFISEIVSQLITIMGENLPLLISSAMQILQSLIQVLVDNADKVSDFVLEMVSQFEQLIIQNLPQILNSGITILLELIKGMLQALPQMIPTIVETVMTIADELTKPNNLMLIIDAALSLIKSLAQGLIDAIPEIVKKLPEIIDNILTFLDKALPDIVDAGVDLFIALVQNMPEIISLILEELPRIITSIVGKFGSPEMMQKMIDAGVKLLVSLVDDMPKITMTIIGKIPELIASIVAAFMGEADQIKGVGENLINGLWEGISGSVDWLKDRISNFAGGVLDTVKDFFGIASPSKVFKNQIGKNLALGVGVGFMESMDKVSDEMAEAIPTDFNIESRLNNNSTTSWKNYGNEYGEYGRNNDISRATSNGYNISLNISNFNNYTDRDIDTLAEMLMNAMTELTERQGVVFA